MTERKNGTPNTPSSPDNWAGKRGASWAQHADPLEAMLAGVNPALIAALAPQAGETFADIGCGGGTTAAAIHDAGPGEISVHGYDISADLIDRARRTQSRPRLDFHVSDAGTDRPDAAPFDGLVSRFGIMFFDDPASAFSNLRSWLKPGGRFAFAAWTAPSDNPWMQVIRSTVTQFVEMPTPEPDSPGPFRYQDAAAFTDILQAAGFTDIATTPWLGHLRLGGGLSAEDAAEFALGAFSIGNPIKALDASIQQDVRDVLAETFASHIDSAGHVAPGARVHIMTGKS